MTINNLQRDDSVLVRLHDDRAVEGRVEQVFDTTSGKKARIVSGDLVITVGIDQIVEAR
jgi:hypothetical protein